MTLSLKSPGNVWGRIVFCVTKCLGRNGFHVTKRLLAEMSCYPVIIHGEPVHQEFSVNRSTNNLKEKVCLFL